MKKRIGVLTDDSSLYSKLRLLLRGIAEVDRLEVGYNGEIYDLTFTDTDSYEAESRSTVTMSRGSDADITIPFLHEDVLRLVESAEQGSSETLTLLEDGRHVVLMGEKIRLTEVEHRLLSELLSAQSVYVSREELLSKVWGEGFDAGVVNVYVHYLRTKLERDGRKIILSSRKEGYGIDEKYRRGR